MSTFKPVLMLFAAIMLAAVLRAQPALVTVNGPINGPNGAGATVRITVSNPLLICSGVTIPASSQTYSVLGGVVSPAIQLYALASCSPSYAYDVLYSGSVRSTAFWAISSSPTTTTIAAIQVASYVPASMQVNWQQLPVGTLLGQVPTWGGASWGLAIPNAGQTALTWLGANVSGALDQILGSAAQKPTNYFQVAMPGAPGAWPTSFTPAAHAVSHASGQADAITPAAIGAESVDAKIVRKDALGNVTLPGTLSVGVPLPAGTPAGSIGAVKFYGDVPVAGKGTATVAMGDSLTNPGPTTDQSLMSSCWYNNMVDMSKGSIRNLHNAGIPGDTTIGMLARFQTDVVAYKPAKVFIMGGTNDGDAPINTYNRLGSMIDLAKAAGIEPILGVMTPVTFTENVPRMQRRALVYKLASDKGVRLVDFYSAVTDPLTGTWKTGLNTDATHPNAVGALLMGQTAWAAVSGMYPAVSATYMPKSTLDPLNAVAGGQMLVDTNLDGVADSWSKNDISGSTAIYSIITDGTGVKWQSMQKTNATSVSQVTQTVGVIAGNKIAISARFKSSGVISGNAMVGITLWPIGGGTTVYPVNGWTLDHTDSSVYLEFVVPALVTGYMWAFSLTTGTGTLQFTQVAVVDLTANGLQ